MGGIFNRGKDEAKEEQEKLGKTIANLSDQVGALQQQLSQKNKQIDQLVGQLTQAQGQAAQGQAAQKATEMTSKATEEALRDAQKHVHDLEKQLGDLVKAKREAEAAVAAMPAAAVTNAAPAQAGGLAVGATAYVQRAGGKNLRRRSGPDLDSKVLDGLEPGTQLTLLEGPIAADGHAWWRIRAADGREGWVAGEELVTSPD